MQQKHFIMHPDQTSNARGTESKLLQTSNRERSIENPNRLANTCFAMMYSSFSPEVKKPQSSLHWDCIECNQSENQFKENLKTSNRTKEAKKESKNDLPSFFCPGPKPLKIKVAMSHSTWKMDRF